MPQPKPLAAEALYQRCEPASFDFETSDELETLDGLVGQERALKALKFGTGIQGQGYNLFVLGPSGTGRHGTVIRFLNDRAQQAPAPSDWCYLHDFERGTHPRLLELPAGQGARFQHDFDQLVEELAQAIPATFESEEYQSRLQELQQELGEHQQQAFRKVSEEAERQQIALIQSSSRFSFAPRDEHGEVMEQEAFNELPQEQREVIQKRIRTLQEQLQEVVQKMPRWRKDIQQRIRKLNEEMAAAAVGSLLEELRDSYHQHSRVLEHIDAIAADVIDNVETLLAGQQDQRHSRAMASVLDRYRANLLIDHGRSQGAPVIYEDTPGHQRIVGRVEHRVQQGALLTDFRLIRAGALHQANGGYLVLDAAKLLTQPLAWESLKRTLYAGAVRIESLEQVYSLASTVSLEPEPMPIDLKVVLIGNRMLYYLLSAYDPDFLKLFKVQADFEEDVARDNETQQLYARLFATLANEAGIRAFKRGAIARLIEHASRLAGDSQRLSTHRRAFADLMREADYWAGELGATQVGAEHVQQAIDQQQRRAARMHENTKRTIVRDILLIATEGVTVGQINGLSVAQLGAHAFGRPTRITATARPGRGGLIDIEREAKLGGNLHSKGVMILSSYLASRYAWNTPLSLSASLAFEQSYGPVDGDSASVAELCALLSVLSGIGLRQSLAVTGSVNQHGQVQAVGGVNEKIEGFFEICAERGLTGEQGVLLPAANVVHLMLRDDVRDAVAQGRFAVYPIATIDEAIALMADRPAGAPDANGHFEEGTINHRVAQRLRDLAAIGRQQQSGERQEDDGAGRH